MIVWDVMTAAEVVETAKKLNPVAIMAGAMYGAGYVTGKVYRGTKKVISVVRKKDKEDK